MSLDHSLNSLAETSPLVSQAIPGAPLQGVKTSCSRPCTHCGLPTVVDGESCTAEYVFCCQGCSGAFELIRGWGLSDFYALRDQLSGSSDTVNESASYEAFDRPTFLGLSAPRSTADGLLATKLALHGLHCGACAWLIENAVRRVPGWRAARVKLSDHTIEITFDPQIIRLSSIAQQLDRLGYKLAPLTKNADQGFECENRQLLLRITVAGFCAANAMWLAIALYAGEASGVEAGHWQLLRLAGSLLGLVAVAGPGRIFLRGGLAALRTRTPHMDLPIALGLSVGTVVGTINAINGSGAVYFDSLAALVFLLLIGRWIQFRQQHRASRAVDLLMRLTPQHARRVIDGNHVELVLVDHLSRGETVRILAGESIPVDGMVICGESRIDRSLLTGESQLVPTVCGDSVCAGTVNMTSSIDVQVDAMGTDTRIGKVMRTVEQASSEKPAVVQLADRVGGVFVIVVTLLAMGTFAAWYSRGWTMAAEHATALLIVACPCALALATPLAIAVTLGRGARRGILIRDGAVLQHLAEPGMVWFDKTGTLTVGKPQVMELCGSTESLSYAAAVEEASAHPLADEIIREARRLGLPIRRAESVTAGMGGINGMVDGRAVAVGNAAFMVNCGVAIGPQIGNAIDVSVRRNMSPIIVALESQAVAVLSTADRLRTDARSTVKQLQRLGWQVGILSGDHEQIVRQVAGELHIPSTHAHGALSPEDKLQAIRQSKQTVRRVVMIGDGANDAAALAVADVGIAIRGGAEVSLQAAPVYIASSRLDSIVELVRGANASKRLILTAFAVSLSYNVVAVALAITGQISPLVAAVLMPLSSVSVLSLTLAWPTIRIIPGEEVSS